MNICNQGNLFSQWKGLCNVAGMASLIIVLIILLDIILSFVPAGATPEPGKGTPEDWFRIFDLNIFYGLRGLGLLNIINELLMIPIVLALYLIIREKGRTWATLASVMFFIGVVVYIANNAGFQLIYLSEHFYNAGSQEEKNLILGAGHAALSRGEDFTPGSFPGFFLISVGEIVIMILMFRHKGFKPALLWSGLIGFSMLFLFTIWATFIPLFYTVAMLFAIVGGLLSLVWYVLISRRLCQMGGLAETL